MVLFVGAHRPDRKPVFRVFGFPGFPVFRAFGGSGLPDNRGFGVPVCGFPGSDSGSDSGFCSGFCRGCGKVLLFRTSSAPDASGPPSGAVRDPDAGSFGRFTSGFGRSPFISDAVRGPSADSAAGCRLLLSLPAASAVVAVARDQVALHARAELVDVHLRHLFELVAQVARERGAVP